MQKPDYQSLIDAEIRAFIDRTNAFFPPGSAGATIEAQRANYDRMCQAFRQPYPSGVSAQDKLWPVPLRVYETEVQSGTLVYFHGGGFVVGGLESHDDVCADICGRGRLRVISVDYRLAPEHRHPAAFADALAATRQIASDHGPLILAGDSAGGNLAAAVAHILRGSQTRIKAVALIYPDLGAGPATDTMARHAHAPMLTAADVEFYRRIRGGAPADPTVAVLQDRDFTNLPPIWICGAECDPLCDDGRLYAEQIGRAGGTARFHIDEGLVHGWLRARTTSSRARAAFARMIDALQDMAAMP